MPINKIRGKRSQKKHKSSTQKKLIADRKKTMQIWNRLRKKLG